MSDNLPSNIFDYSKKIGSGPKKKPISPKPAIIPTTPAKPISDEEAKELVQKMKQMYQNLEGEIDEICKKNDVSIEWVKNFLDNSNNFNPDVWKLIQQEREKQLQKLWEILGVEEKTKHSQKIEDKQVKERKAKSIGSRKRGWIQMS